MGFLCFAKVSDMTLEDNCYGYLAYGLRIHSKLKLVNVAPCALSDQFDVAIRLGSVARGLRDPVDCTDWYETASNTCLFYVRDVGRFLIREGREIVIAPEPDVPETSLSIYVMGSAFGVLLHQRGLLPLHANSVCFGDWCAAFMGPSGAGKSTLTAYLNRQNHRVLNDDVCPVELRPDHPPSVLSGFSRFKLWEDSLHALGQKTTGLCRIRPEFDKFFLAFPESATPVRVPLRRIYLLNRSEHVRHPHVERLAGFPGFQSLVENTFAYQFIMGLGLAQRHAVACAELLRSVPVYCLHYPSKFHRLPDVQKCLEREVAQSLLSRAA